MKRATGLAVEAIEYTVRRSRRRRRTMAITVDTEGAVRVAAPNHVSSVAIAAFVRARASWIEKQRNASRTTPDVPKRLVNGESLLFLGREYALRVDAGTNRHTQVRLEGRVLAISVPQLHDTSEAPVAVKSALEAWYRLEAARVIANRMLHYKQRVGVEPIALSISNARRQWGSCGSEGTIRISWRLIMAPLSLIDYVIVHELCHLSHSNHGRRFWDLMATILPDCESLRSRLRREGDRYTF